MEKILDNISSSIEIFKPSKSLEMISLQSERDGRIDHHTKKATQIDLVISGGGLKGFFMVGVKHVLTRELHKRKITIARISGASAGAWSGLFICCGFTTHDWMKTYYALQDRPNDPILKVYEDMVKPTSVTLAHEWSVHNTVMFR